jgi:hypothetical protein
MKKYLTNNLSYNKISKKNPKFQTFKIRFMNLKLVLKICRNKMKKNNILISWIILGSQARLKKENFQFLHIWNWKINKIRMIKIP